MMGESPSQNTFMHVLCLEDLVPQDHPFRRIRPLVDTAKIRELCKDFYCADNGRPSIPPEQLFLAWLGGYLMGCHSDRKIVMQLKCDMAFKWFVGLDISDPVWDDSTFAKNRTQRFEGTKIFEKLFDETVKAAKKHGYISGHWSADGTLVRADASHKSWAPIEVHETPDEYRLKITGKRKSERTKKRDDDEDRGNPDVRWNGEKRSNATHRSTTDPDARLAQKSGSTNAQPGYTVNGVMENRNRILVGIGVEVFGGHAERDGCLNLVDKARKLLKGRVRVKSLGADKGYFAAEFMRDLRRRKIAPHIAALETGMQRIHHAVRKLAGDVTYEASQRARKKIEELWGEAKEFHGFRRFRRRGLENVRQEAFMLGWLLNLKRLASLQAAV